MFKGAFSAIVTPFKNNEIDEEAFSSLIEFQIQSGIHGIVPCGTTGESATLFHEEHNRIIELAVEVVNKRVAVIAGAGSNSTKEAVTFTRHAKKAGADAALLITPYYNKPSQEGLFRHFKTISDEVDIPQFLYNVPGRTCVDLLPETVARLSAEKNVIGIKDAAGDLSVTTDIIALSQKGFIILSGDDSLTFPMLCVGASGVISVTANLLPGEISSMCELFHQGDIEDAKEIHYKVRLVNQAMFYETNPVPVKTALSLTGRISPEVRPPLCEMTKDNLKRFKDVLKGYGEL
ncbi:MAG: 4-hydroxy-tetrahydrodipicolinate synthase [Nitrospinota bacterium]